MNWRYAYSMPTVDDILDVLRTIDDPEMPISIVDLGIVDDVQVQDDCVVVNILPTFIGCPALPMIEGLIREKIRALPNIATVDVHFLFDPPWTVDRISESGRASLKEHGVTVPEHGSRLAVHDRTATIPLHTSAVPCPYCNSRFTRLDSPFGPTRCRMIHYCEACRNSFEHMKRV